MSPKPPTLLLVASLALPALAEELPAAPAPTPAPTKPAPQAGKEPAAPPGTAKNMIVTRDPETGQIRPATPAEREKLLGRRPLAAVAERPVVVLPDGSLMVEMGPANMSYAVAKKNPDGTISQSCVHGAEAAAKKAAAAPSASQAPAPAPAER